MENTPSAENMAAELICIVGSLTELGDGRSPQPSHFSKYNDALDYFYAWEDAIRQKLATSDQPRLNQLRNLIETTPLQAFGAVIDELTSSISFFTDKVAR
ncbi:MAG: hypothetical protein AB1894_27220 [Chloroflexota bacterium]